MEDEQLKPQCYSKSLEIILPGWAEPAEPTEDTGRVLTARPGPQSLAGKRAPARQCGPLQWSG